MVEIKLDRLALIVAELQLFSEWCFRGRAVYVFRSLQLGRIAAPLPLLALHHPMVPCLGTIMGNITWETIMGRLPAAWDLCASMWPIGGYVSALSQPLLQQSTPKFHPSMAGYS